MVTSAIAGLMPVRDGQGIGVGVDEQGRRDRVDVIVARPCRAREPGTDPAGCVLQRNRRCQDFGPLGVLRKRVILGDGRRQRRVGSVFGISPCRKTIACQLRARNGRVRDICSYYLPVSRVRSIRFENGVEEAWKLSGDFCGRRQTTNRYPPRRLPIRNAGQTDSHRHQRPASRKAQTRDMLPDGSLRRQT
jgi:hypothetical protein